MVPVQVAQRHPHLHGVGFDLPQVRPVFEKFVADHGLGPRVSFSGGDFFADPLPPAEVYILGHILHDWGMDAKRALLQRTYDALPDGGAVIVYETLIDDERRANVAGLLMSSNMLVLTDAGFD
jgi:O-methyltransferase domain